MDKKFIVDFRTGENVAEFASIEEAKVYAEEHAAYTGVNVSILKGDVEVAYLPWNDATPSVDDEVIAAFGSQGFYGAWINR